MSQQESIPPFIYLVVTSTRKDQDQHPFINKKEAIEFAIECSDSGRFYGVVVKEFEDYNLSLD